MISARAPALRNQAWISLLLLGFGLAAAWILGGWLAAGDLLSLADAAVGLAVCIVAVAILKDWRSGVYFFLVWLLSEDLIRKYMGNNMAIYFAKDLLAVFTYLSLFVEIRRRRASFFRPPFLLFLGLFFWLGVLQCFNPAMPSLVYGLLGMKLYFFYIPLMFVGYALIRKEEDLRRFLVANMSVAGIIALLGIIQATTGPRFLNPPVLAPEIRLLSTLYRYAPISGAVVYRPNSVFVSDGRFAWYLLLGCLLGLGAAGFLIVRRLRGQAIVLVGLALVVVAAILSGSRGSILQVVASVLIFVAAFLWGAPKNWGPFHRLVKALRRGFIIAGFGILLAVLLFPNAIGARWAFYSETLSPSSPAEELTFRVQDYPFQELRKTFTQDGWVLGHGIGTASLGMQYVSRWLGQSPPGFGVESGYGDLVLEFGILGLLLWFLWTGTLLLAAWKAVCRLRHTPYFPVGFAIFWFAFLLLVPMTYASLDAYQNYVYNAFMWLLVGILFRLPTLAAPAVAVPVSPDGA